jgi:hypothetical protein
MIPLYISNVGIALGRIGRATVGAYQYHPGDGYVKNWWAVVDCFGNALRGGDPDETISSWTAKARAAGDEWACVFCAFLTWCQNKLFRKPGDHCTHALERNVGSRAVLRDDNPDPGTS